MKTILENPKLYDILYQDIIDDIQFYIRLLKDYPEIVEYGAGSGRITIPLANEGHMVLAVDNEPLMLNYLKTKISNTPVSNRIKTLVADITNLSFDNLKKCILVPFTTFNYLLDDISKNKCLQNISRSLAKDGIAIFELITLYTYPELFLASEFIEVSKYFFEDYYLKYERRTTFSESQKLLYQDRRFSKFDLENHFLSSEHYKWCNSYIELNTFISMAQSCGLDFVMAYGDTNGSAYTEQSNDLFVILKKI